ncbi:MAG: S8 family serine peptidase, partial [Acidimicrobiia bacterium]|nr:S8 family serine peptidase [Acidimicrobiia bacterium]
MRWRVAAVVGAVVLITISGPARGETGRFPSADPDPRVGTPDDPAFDCAEPDDEDAVDPCGAVWDEQFNLFGFAPSSTRLTATYRDVARFGQGQVSGVGADQAWKVTTGRADATVAVTDTGIRWENADIATKVRLNEGELPLPMGASTHDVNGDGAVTVADYAGDPRVVETNDNGAIDPQDILRTFSDGTDGDANGYVDDIAGWDFFDDDNDPEDVSSYSAARNHGSGRAEEAVQVTDDAAGEAGVCPDCTLLPLRVWDSFVVIGDQFGMAVAYAADEGVASVVVALGVLQNTITAREAVRYAYEKGVVVTSVSSDLNTANHNYPTNYDETVFINGCVADTHGLGRDASELNELFVNLGLGSQLPVSTWFRNSNLTQYGAHAHVCFTATTGSEATGQAGGAAALLVSRGRDVADDIGGPLTPNEVKQLLTTTAEDVRSENTVGVGVPDPAQPGFDEHFGYGRADLGAAVARIAPGQIPPEALLTGPAWWSMLPTTGTAPVLGRVAAERSGSFTYDLAWAPGVEPTDAEFTSFASGGGSAPIDGALGAIPLGAVADALPGAAAGTPSLDPNAYVFTVRVTVTDAQGNRGEDRRAYFAFDDPTALPGWPRFTDTGGESSPVLADLDGDARLEIVEADSSGRITVTRADGTPLPTFNGGRPWILPPTYNAHLDAPGFATGRVTAPNGGLRTPAVYDIDGDLAPEIVAAAVDGRLFVLDADGSVADGFPVGVDPALSAVALRTRDHHVKRGFLAAPSVADLDGDGTMEIVAAALDGHVYAWSAIGVARPGFPVRLADPAVADPVGGELISTPGIGDLDGDGDLEIVVESSEVYGDSLSTSPDPEDVAALFNRLLEGGPDAAGSFGRVYAIHDDGALVDGWPVPLGGLLPDILPFVAPAMTVALADLDEDGDDEVVAGIVSGTQRVLDGDGTELRQLRTQGPVVGGDSPEVQLVNLAEYPVIGDLGDGTLSIAKGGATLNTAINLLLVGQNLPYDHVLQVYDATTGEYRPGFPHAVEDYMILSTPAIADAGGGPEREVIVGTGLYLIHAFGPLGQEAPGFPKLTGGWNYAVPAVGDLDGDGTLEMVASTREGWRFAWTLGTPVAGGDEWWTEAHDECHTNRYGTDCRPPAAPQQLTLQGGALNFTAPGDDWLAGQATAYEVRVSARPIESFADWEAASPVVASTTPGAASTTETLRLPAGTTSVAVIAIDDAGNRSQLAAVGPGAGSGGPG